MSFLCDPGQKPDRDPEGQAKNCEKYHPVSWTKQ